MSNIKTPAQTTASTSSSASAAAVPSNSGSATSSQTASPAIRASSAWAKGPPTAVAAAAAAASGSESQTSANPSTSSNGGSGSAGDKTNNVSTISKDVQLNGTTSKGVAPSASGGKGNGSAASSGAGSDAGGAVSNGASGRKGLSFGVAGNESRGLPIPSKAIPTHAASNSIAFGTTALPDAILSSSPAAQPTTGSHLSDSIKTFGSVDASNAAAGHGVVGMSGRKSSGGAQTGTQPSSSSAAGTGAPVKSKFDVNKLFQGGAGGAGGAGASASSSPSVAHSTPSSTSGGGSNPPFGPNGIPSRPPPQSNNANMSGMTSPIRQSAAGHPYAEAQALQAQNPSRGMGGLPQAYGYDAQGRPMAYPQQQQQHPSPYGMNPYPPLGQGQGQGQGIHNAGGPGSFRPPGGMKSPQMGHVQPHSPYNPQAPQFRPPGQQHGGSGGQARGGQGTGSMHSPRLGGQHQGQGGAFVVRPPQQPYGGMSPYAQQQQQYYPFFPPQQENPYGGSSQGWAGQQPPYGQLPLSPRPGPSSIGPGSPAPVHSGLPVTSTLGPNSPSNSSRPPSMSAAGHSNSAFSTTSSQHSSVPTTPSMTPARTSSFGGPTFTPSHLHNPSLHATASTFVPRAKSAAIKITRDDGTQVDLAAAAAAAVTPTKAPAAAVSSPSPAPVKKPVFAPVVVRMETEEQKAARLAEDAKEKKIKDEEEKEAKERKEREVARKAREEKEKVEKAEAEEKAKAAADQKAKADAERAAQDQAAAEAAAARQKEEQEAAEKQAKEASDKKKAEEDAAAKKAEEDDAAAKKAEEESAAKQKATEDAESRKKAETEIADQEVIRAKQASLAPKQGPDSAASSPKGSPALGVAGLPSKPVTPTPAPLERKATAPIGDLSQGSTPASPNPQSAGTASAQDIKGARPISNLSAVTYPTDMQAPDPGLNQDSTSGKYRYDRNFLLQFMRICLERPVDMQVPEDVGMFANPDAGADFGRTQSNRGGARGGGGSRNASGLGMPMGGSMGNFGSKTAAGGAIGGFGMGGGMGMGSFGSGTRGTSSEDRLAASRSATGSSLASARSTAGMVRTPSQGGPGGAVMPPSNLRDGSGLRERERENTRIRSQRGTQRGQRDPPRGSTSNIFSPGGLEPGVAPLELSANRWTPAVQNRRPGAIDENSPEYVERKVKGLLNKLTEEKFDSISGQILEWANKSAAESDGMTLRLVIKLIFEKAKDEQFWSRMYARLCRKLLETVSNEVKDDQLTVNDPKLVGGFLFRKYLLNRCQEDFERGWKAKEDSSAAAKSKAVDDEAKKAEHAEAVAAGKQVEEFKFSDEYYAMAAAKRQGLGLVKFVGELFKLDMLSAKIIANCVQKLLVNVKDPDEEDVESLCQLLSTVGDRLEKHSPQMHGMVGVYLKRLQELQASEHISSRMKFMVQDVIELQKHKWVARSNQRESGPMTIDEVHQQAARDAQEAARTAAQQQANARNDPMSRGGSRRGDQRSGGPPGANEQWQSVNVARLPAKPADMSSFGKFQKSGGPANSFQPQSFFSGKKKAGENPTPPISRIASSSNISANPFGALANEGEGAGPVAPEEDVPQRKKLVLAPRSKNPDSDEPTTPGAQDEDAEAETGADADADASAPGLSKSEIERKIKNDRLEFWGEKDVGGTRNPDDIVEYFEGLPEDGESRGLLAQALVEDVFRIVKQKDTAVVVQGFERATEKGLLTEDVAKQGLASTIEGLDDAAIDIPQAYAFAAQLMVACGLSQEIIEALSDTIEVLGEPLKTPKSKLLAEVAKLNAETEA